MMCSEREAKVLPESGAVDVKPVGIRKLLGITIRSRNHAIDNVTAFELDILKASILGDVSRCRLNRTAPPHRLFQNRRQ
jgi:hypothetical protein